MIYQDFQGMKLSNLGLGCMRLPVADGNDAVVDQAAVEEMAALAMERGVNYYDTAWAFRFLQRIPNVTVILSGMSNLEQLKDNLATFETEDSLTKEEWDGLLALGGEMTNPKALACTACWYCTSHCPQGLDIPHLLALYNEHRFTGGGFIAPMALSPSHRTGSQAPASAAAAATEEFPRFSGGGAYKGAAGHINGGLWHRKAKWSVSSK